jgi:protein-S-isoprenylcysteine O-methyltransferase Ste14
MQASGKFVGLCWAAVILVWAISALSVKRTKERQPLFGRLLYLWLIAIVAILLNGGIRAVHLTRAVLPHTLGTAIVADLFVLAGLVIAVWARVVLGRNWSARVTFKENHELIQSGPYQLVRHPIYSGLLLMILGTAVLSGHLGGFVATIVCFCGFWIKLRQEEVLLTRRLPGYSEYMTRTKALVPFLF